MIFLSKNMARAGLKINLKQYPGGGNKTTHCELQLKPDRLIDDMEGRRIRKVFHIRTKIATTSISEGFRVLNRQTCADDSTEIFFVSFTYHTVD
jgi:hypothetical protein